MAQPASYAANGATLDFLKELVASSIECDDVGPLVKAVFEVAPPGEQLPLPLPRGSESATTSQGGAGQEGAGSVLDSILLLLQEVAEEKEAEIQKICRSNAADIAGAMHELGAMQRDTAALRQQLLAHNGALQGAGAAFAARLEELHEVAALQGRLAAARQAVGVALQVLLLCARAARCIEAKQLYKAYKTLEAVQRDYGDVLRGGSSDSTYPSLLPGAASGGGRDGAALKAAPPGGAWDAAGLGEQLGPLAAVLRGRVAELAALLEQRAVADFNNWLLAVRAQARTIGMRAIRWAAAERQQEEALTRQRKLVLPALEGLGDLRQAGDLVARSLRAPELREAPPATPLPLPSVAATPKPATPASGGAAAETAAAASPQAGSSIPAGSSGSNAPNTTAARIAAFKAARQAAGTSPTRASAPTMAPAAPADASPTPPGTASSASNRASPAAYQTPQPQAGSLQRSDTLQATGNLLEGVDMAPLHRCVHIHACLGRLPQLADYYARNRRQQLAADLALHQGDFLGHYQAYLTQLVGFFLVEDAVQEAAAGGTGEPLNIVAQVDAAWDAAVAALKAALEPAFRGATAAAAMLTVKDFMLLVCLALDHSGFQTVAVREVLMNSRAKYHDLLAAATAASVQAAVARDNLTPVEVPSQARADELLRQLALPPTFHPQASAAAPIGASTHDAENKRPPFKAPFSSMAPELARAIRGYTIDSVAYLKGLLTAGEVVPAARQYRDRMLARVVAPALQRRVDTAAGDPQLPVAAGLQLVANVAALQHALGPLDEFLLAQARGETAETMAAAAAAASRSPSPGPRGRSRSRSPTKRPAGGGEDEQRGRQWAGRADDAEADDGGGSPARSRSRSRSSRGSAPSPMASPAVSAAAAAAVTQQAAGGSQQPGHTVLSFTAAPGAAAGGRPMGGGAGSAAAAGGAAAALQGLLLSAEALVVQAVAAKAAVLLAAGEQLDWAPAEQPRSTAYSPHIDELIMCLKECGSLLKRSAPADSAERVLRGVLRYVGDAVMLQLMSDAVPAYNIFGLQRLFSDLGGLSRTAGSMGVPGLAEGLTEPLLFCEMMVFGSLDDVLKPELRLAGGRLAALDVRRLVLVLEKYRELEKVSGFSAMHKSKQAERFISRKTVDRVLKELRKEADTSRAASRASSSAGSFTAAGGGPGSFMMGGGGGGGVSHGSSFTTAKSG